MCPIFGGSRFRFIFLKINITIGHDFHFYDQNRICLSYGTLRYSAFFTSTNGRGHEVSPYPTIGIYTIYITIPSVFPPVFKRAVLKIGFLHRYKHFWYRFDIKYAILG